MTPEASARHLTVLAWRRTGLRWVVVAVVAARIFTDRVGAVVVIVAFVAVAVAAGLDLAVERRSLPDALRSSTIRLGIVVVGTLALGIAALAWVLTQ